jgi:hypothetical protein
MTKEIQSKIRGALAGLCIGDALARRGQCRTRGRTGGYTGCCPWSGNISESLGKGAERSTARAEIKCGSGHAQRRLSFVSNSVSSIPHFISKCNLGDKALFIMVFTHYKDYILHILQLENF